MTLGSCFPVSSTLTTRCRRRFYDVDHSGTKISELFSVKFIFHKKKIVKMNSRKISRNFTKIFREIHISQKNS